MAATFSRIQSDFEELRPLGRGGQAAVYSAIHRLTRAPYALKVTPVNRKRNEHFTCLREAGLLAHLPGHPNVVRYHNTWLETGLALEIDGDDEEYEEYTEESDDDMDPRTTTCGRAQAPVERRAGFDIDAEKGLAVVIQMELCNGGTLEDWLRTHGPGDIDQGLAHLRGVLQGIAHIHRHNILHRDIKPANILFDRGIAKLVDFGLSVSGMDPPTSSLLLKNGPEDDGPGERSVQAAQRTSELGTALYASPEQKGTSGIYTTSSDMWAFGLVLAEVLHVGKLSTVHERIEVFGRLRQGVIAADILEAFPEASRVVLGLLNPDPELRPKAEDLLASPVFSGSAAGQLEAGMERLKLKT
jgi:serine/threonine protein kinase